MLVTSQIPIRSYQSRWEFSSVFDSLFAFSIVSIQSGFYSAYLRFLPFFCFLKLGNSFKSYLLFLISTALFSVCGVDSKFSLSVHPFLYGTGWKMAEAGGKRTSKSSQLRIICEKLFTILWLNVSVCVRVCSIVLCLQMALTMVILVYVCVCAWVSVVNALAFTKRSFVHNKHTHTGKLMNLLNLCAFFSTITPQPFSVRI